MSRVENNEPLAHEKRLLREPETETINISGKRDPKSYKLIAKLTLKKFGKVELRSLNTASSSVVTLAESLVRNGFAVYEKLTSDVVDVEDRENEGQSHSSVSFIVVLKKSAEFDIKFTDLN